MYEQYQIIKTINGRRIDVHTADDRCAAVVDQALVDFVQPRFALDRLQQCFPAGLR